LRREYVASAVSFRIAQVPTSRPARSDSVSACPYEAKADSKPQAATRQIDAALIASPLGDRRQQMRAALSAPKVECSKRIWWREDPRECAAQIAEI
jgi:hypothetical protein